MNVFDDDDTKDLMQHVGIDAAMMAEAIRVADLDLDGEVSEVEFRKALDSISQPPMKCDIRAVHQKVSVFQK